MKTRFHIAKPDVIVPTAVEDPRFVIGTKLCFQLLGVGQEKNPVPDPQSGSVQGMPCGQQTLTNQTYLL